LYRGAFRGLPGALRKRRLIQSSRAISAGTFLRYMTPRFYDADYLWAAIRSPFSRNSGQVRG
jgi:hypothetical protein